MSRHRSPGRQRGARPPVAPHDGGPRHRAASAAHHGMGAAAAGGLLAAVAPLAVGAATNADAAAVTTPEAGAALRLAADQSVGPATGTPVLMTPVSAIDLDPGSTTDAGQTATAASLIKAAGLAEAARAEEEAAALDCGAAMPQLGRVKTWTRDAAEFVACMYDEPDVLGVGSRGGRVSDHPRGLAVDFMTSGEQGDRIARCVLNNQDEMAVSYVIWEQRINYGDGWEPMEDRGGATANHYDHVHVSFEPRAGGGEFDPSVCT